MIAATAGARKKEAAKEVESLALPPLKVRISGGPDDAQLIEVDDPRASFCEHWNRLWEGTGITAVPVNE